MRGELRKITGSQRLCLLLALAVLCSGVLFAPHGIRSYFAKPFYTEQGLHAILILASLRPGSFGADAETRFASLMGPFERLIGAWRKG